DVVNKTYADLKVLKTTTICGTGLASGGGDLSTNRTIDVPIASQAEAEAGAINTKAMTPQRTAQEIAALQVIKAIASQVEAEAGTDNIKGMTPLRVAQAIAALVGVQGNTTGDAKLTLKTVADTGWVIMNDGT